MCSSDLDAVQLRAVGHAGRAFGIGRAVDRGGKVFQCEADHLAQEVVSGYDQYVSLHSRLRRPVPATSAVRESCQSAGDEKKRADVLFVRLLCVYLHSEIMFQYINRLKCTL